MRILLIDGQGGKMGRELCLQIRSRFPGVDLVCVGTNSMATASMMKGGATQVATGENAVCVCAREAEVIVGPIGIVMADAMLGEITPAMALAVARSRAKKILLPTNRCNHLIAGIGNQTVSMLIEDAMEKISMILQDYQRSEGKFSQESNDGQV